jgi:hypothetical protein
MLNELAGAVLILLASILEICRMEEPRTHVAEDAEKAADRRPA